MKVRLMILLALLALWGGGAALAQTPDGIPPALETVCDMETGAAFGLCNAYCEAMDCETNDPHASATACSKVRTKFQQVTGRDLPCELPCPCTDPSIQPPPDSGFQGFADVLAGDVSIDLCLTAPFLDILDGVIIVDFDQNQFFPGFSVEGLVGEEGGQWICGLVAGLALPISPEQGHFCADLLEQAAAAQAVTCGPSPI